eukprot:12062820-Prorocentrum_lima.AAC.1
MTSSLVGSEMCIRDRFIVNTGCGYNLIQEALVEAGGRRGRSCPSSPRCCLLYTSDAADDM